MQKAILIISGIILAVGLGMWFSDDFNYFIKSNVRLVKQDPAQLCVDYEKQNFASPKSVKYYNSYRASNSEVIVTVLAKNPMGVEVQSTIKCYLDDGKFDKTTHFSKTINDKYK
ncbi:hypothetical protein [Budvicia aquatica]|uniref:Uncharacterized protein n=1 Tax=Budvicia aquatica TaxID=82979 RepID=A0A2C6CWJ3_9GAMM|nr:hypothetical protein [Budvicia aquatica]PHI31029.1 hypothetical protein CRN84_17660 [Budvicia aquatica]VFS51197.1 Uncharacterised protein [Budvicia aquatica]